RSDILIPCVLVHEIGICGLDNGPAGFRKNSLCGKKYLIHDRDPLYTKEFLSIIAGCGIEPIKLPPRSPNLNAYAERFVRIIKESCLERMIFFGEDATVPHALLTGYNANS